MKTVVISKSLLISFVESAMFTYVKCDHYTTQSFTLLLHYTIILLNVLASQFKEDNCLLVREVPTVFHGPQSLVFTHIHFSIYFLAIISIYIYII